MIRHFLFLSVLTCAAGLPLDAYAQPRTRNTQLVLEDLQSDDPEYQLMAIEELQRWRSGGEFAAPVLRRLVESPDPQVRDGAAQLLQRFGKRKKPEPAELTGLDSDAASERLQALITIGNMRSVGPALRKRVEGLVNDPDRDVAETAGKVLRKISLATRTAPSATIAERKVETTGRAEPTKAEAPKAPQSPSQDMATFEKQVELNEKRVLEQELRKDDDGLRAALAPPMEAPPPARTQAVPAAAVITPVPPSQPTPSDLGALRAAFREKFASQNAAERSAAAYQLGEFVSEVIPLLAKDLESSDPRARSAASFALGRLGPAGIPALAKGLSSKDAKQRLAAAQGLRLAAPVLDRSTLELLRALVKDPSREVRVQSALALAALLPSDPTPVNVLFAELATEDPALRTSVAVALAQLGSASEPLLRESLKSTSARVRSAAVTAYGLMYPRPKDFDANVQPLLKDKDEGVAEAARQALNSK